MALGQRWRVRGLGGGVALLLARMLTVPLSLVSTIALTRWLGPDEYGHYALCLTLATFANCFSYAGIDQLFLQGRLTERNLVRYLTLWQAVYISLSAIVVCLYPGRTGRDILATILLAIGTATVNLTAVALLPPQRNLLFARRAAIELSVRCLSVIPLVTFSLFLAPDLLWGAAFTAIGGVLALGFAALAVRRKRGKSQPREGGIPKFRAAIRRGLPFGVTSALFLVNRQVPVMVLGLLAVSAADVGNARLALTLFSVLCLVGSVLNHDILRPRLYKGGDRRRLSMKFLLINVALGVVVAMSSLLLGGRAIDLLFGADYALTAQIFQLMCIAAPLFYLSAFADTVLIASGARLSVVIRLAVALVATTVLVLTMVQDDVSSMGAVVLISEALALALVAPAAFRVLQRGEASPQLASGPA